MHNPACGVTHAKQSECSKGGWESNSPFANIRALEAPPLTRFIILRRVPYGDTSLVLHLFSAAHGRQSALAKGAFREKSPVFGSLDLLNAIDASLGGRRAEALKLLTHVELVDARRGLRRNLRILSAALYTLELLDSALTEAPAPALFVHFERWLAWLETEEANDPAALRAQLFIFELQFLDDAGLRPAFDSCASCGNAIDATRRVPWLAPAGGVLCAACAARMTTNPPAFSPETVAVARQLAAGSATVAPSIRESRELRAFLDRFHAYHLDHALRSRPSLEILASGSV